MILVDTSILIGYLKGKNEYPFNEMDKIIDNDIPYGINNLIYQEILQGARNQKEFNLLKEYLNTLPFYELKFDKKSYENAALINIKCREQGITIRSTIDLIIAETAIEHNLCIYHDDNDYRNMSKIIKELKLYNK
ncbi:MAG: PIN domain nuclease [Spirochaetales bacterium]|jgi:predicted nucleic acid-binding protein|nr:PIN domain nuclease [Spirochaetales bacterium]